MARIDVDVIDGGCSLRRVHIAARIENALLQEGVLPHEYQVCDFASVSDWQREVQGREPRETHLIVLHVSSRENGWQSVVQFIGDAQTQGTLSQCAIASYSGSSGALFKAGRYVAGEQTWWHHFPDVKAVEDYYPDIQGAKTVGLSSPPIDDIVHSVLSKTSLTDDSMNVGNVVATGMSASELRHTLVNAVAPLREAAAFALATNQSLVEFSAMWARLKDRIAQHLKMLPTWVERSLRSLDTTIPSCIEDTFKREGALQSLVFELSRIEGYARSIGRPQIDWESAASTLRGEWEDSPPRVLWIDDEPAWYSALKPVFAFCGIVPEFIADPVAWLDTVPDVSEYDAIVLDIILEGYGVKIAEALDKANVAVDFPIDDSTAGQAILQLLTKNPLCPAVFMLSARESASVIAACTKYGASDYFIKGETDYTRFLLSLRREIRTRRIRYRSIVSPNNPNIVVSGAEDPLNKILLIVHQIASSGSRGPVLLFGEPGIGKEEIARECHLRSSRRNCPFVIADCSALSPSLIESELFGHVKGAFTGATSDKAGRFDEADGGTLFIDEIDKIDVALQNKLLRATEAKTIRRVGGSTDNVVDVLLILASNLEPRRAATEGKLSEQLISRQKFTLPLPPLRARAIAVPELANGLCARICQEVGWPVRTLSRDAVEWLRSQASVGYFDGEVGNVRGLRNLLEAALVYNPSETVLTKYHLKSAADTKTCDWNVLEGADIFREAGKLVAELVVSLDKTTLKWIEERFRAAMFEALRGRLSRDELRTKFNMTPAGLRQHFQVLRDKGLLSEDI